MLLDVTYIDQIRNFTKVETDLATPVIITDDEIRQYMVDAEDILLTSTNKKFEETEVTEVYDGDGSSKLFLRHYPVISISSLIIGTTSKDDDDYYLYDDIGKIVLKNNALFVENKRNVSIIYKWGFVDEDILKLAKRACFLLASRLVLFAKGNYDSQGLVSEKLDQYTLRYDNMPYGNQIKDIDNEIQRLIVRIGIRESLAVMI